MSDCGYCENLEKILNHQIDCRKEAEKSEKKLKNDNTVLMALREVESQQNVIFGKEIERLKQDIEQHIKWNEEHTKSRVELAEENKHFKKIIESLAPERLQDLMLIVKMKETLKKCDPWGMNIESDCPRCNQGVGELYCLFCGGTPDTGHEELCEYKRLIGEVGENAK